MKLIAQDNPSSYRRGWISIDTIGSSCTDWTPNDIGKTVIVPGLPSMLITGYENQSFVEIVSRMKLSSWNQTMAERWYLYDFSSQTLSVRESECQHELVAMGALQEAATFVLDLNDEIALSSRVAVTYTAKEVTSPLLNIRITSPKNVDNTRSLIKKLGYQIYSVHLKNRILQKGVTSLTFSLQSPSMLCPATSITATLIYDCPVTKKLVFHYPYVISDEDFLRGRPLDKYNRTLLFELPVNYRPPSKFGIAISTNDHIYNADPSQPRLSDLYQISKSTGSYKMCLGKSTRTECGCSDILKLSPRREYSDCRERVYRQLHPGKVTLNLTIEDDGKVTFLKDSQIVKVDEVNDREDYYVTQSASVTDDLVAIQKLAGSQYVCPNGTSLTLMGSGLYHFHVTLFHGFTCCNLTEEFQIYVDEAPIAYPLQYVLNLGVGIIIGGILFVIYLWYLHEHHTLRVRKTGSLCQDLHQLYVKQHEHDNDIDSSKKDQ